MTYLEAYRKLAETICLNVSPKKRIKFNLDKDTHIDCKDAGEAMLCLRALRKAIEGRENEEIKTIEII